VLARFEDGAAALTVSGDHYYLACWPDMNLLDSLMGLLTTKAGLRTLPLPESIRLRRRGPLLFAFNYGDVAWTLPIAGKLLMGKQTLEPQQVTILLEG
jgi:beta-galactosidase